MAVDWCKTCGGIAFSWETHRCPPRFEYRLIGWGDDHWRAVYANDDQSAAETACESDDNDGGEWGIIRAGEAVIDIRDRYGVVTRFNIEAESRPHYSASLAEDQPDDASQRLSDTREGECASAQKPTEPYPTPTQEEMEDEGLGSCSGGGNRGEHPSPAKGGDA